MKQSRIDAAQMGHGHVTPNKNGAKARCGGPGICLECNEEMELLRQARMHSESPLCWCRPELVEDFTSEGGTKQYVHKQLQ